MDVTVSVVTEDVVVFFVNVVVSGDELLAISVTVRNSVVVVGMEVVEIPSMGTTE